MLETLQNDIYHKAREAMIKEQIQGRGIKDEKILSVMRKVPRHLFVENALKDKSYSDYPLPIAEGQTISQPYMVALLTQLLDLKPADRVLEIGTGSGYLTAILAEMAEKVYTIERFKSLSTKARNILDSLGYINIITKIFDGTYGWIGEAPFDRIVISACAPSIPEILVKQLGAGGIMVLPVGDDRSQTLVKITNSPSGIRKEDITLCTFVRLVGEYGWDR